MGSLCYFFHCDIVIGHKEKVIEGHGSTIWSLALLSTSCPVWITLKCFPPLFLSWGSHWSPIAFFGDKAVWHMFMSRHGRYVTTRWRRAREGCICKVFIKGREMICHVLSLLWSESVGRGGESPCSSAPTTCNVSKVQEIFLYFSPMPFHTFFSFFLFFYVM